MGELPIVIVGGGFAGTAAAWAVARAGARAVVVQDRAGASAIGSGALDWNGWDAPVDEAGEAAVLADALLGELVAELSLRLGACLLATREGVVRRALGSDAALLDLEPLAGRRIGVADVGRDDWDAEPVARALAASPWSERTRTTFVALPVKALRAGHERRIAPYDFAALHDDRERLDALARALKTAGAGVDAWLLGPWLGLERRTPTALAELLGAPVGETTSPMGGAAGARFERARDDLFARRSIETRRARVRRVSARGERFLVELDSDAGDTSELEATRVVLATGGVAAGGISFHWAPERGARGFQLPFEAPVLLELDGELAGSIGSLFGPSLENLGLHALERVGIALDAAGEPRGVSGVGGLYAAGDAVSAQPRTVLSAVLGGIRAGSRAVRAE